MKCTFLRSDNTTLEEMKNEARYILMRYVERGLIKRKPCEHDGCDTRKVHGHHPDYTEPLNVVWLCAKHHREVHTYIRAKLSGPKLPKMRAKRTTCDTPWCSAPILHPSECTLDGRYKKPLLVCARCHVAIHQEFSALTKMQHQLVV